MATYRFVAYDIEKNLKKTFDDADITLPQIIYWIQVVANRIRQQIYLLNNTDLFTSTFSSVKVKKDAKGRPYIDLPVQIMNLPNNAGIVYITYNEKTCCCIGPPFAQKVFQSTNITEMITLFGGEYTQPSPSNPYFYRVGEKIDGVKVNRIYLVGIECIDVKDVEIAVLGTLNPSTVCDLDEELPIPDDRIQELIMEVLTLGRFVSMIPEETVNQGEDVAQPITPQVPKLQQQEQQ
jgi:hypothetical protein